LGAVVGAEGAAGAVVGAPAAGAAGAVVGAAAGLAGAAVAAGAGAALLQAAAARANARARTGNANNLRFIETTLSHFRAIHHCPGR